MKHNVNSKCLQVLVNFEDHNSHVGTLYSKAIN